MSIHDPNEQQQSYTAPGASATYDPVTGAPYNNVPPPPPPPYPGFVPPPPHVPNPMLAGLLGFIPGVGAMYNGQFAKGIAHIAIFACLTSLANHSSDIFGLFVAGWIFYMVFEAYQTAAARRDGRPLPDPFSLNHIGERFGFHPQQHPDLNNAWSQTVGKMPGAAPFDKEWNVKADGSAYYSKTDPVTGANTTYQVDPEGNVASSRTAGAAYPPPAGAYDPAAYPPPPATPYGSAPYGAPYDPAAYPQQPYGAPQYGVPPVPPPPMGYGMPPMPPVPPVRRGGLPTGAIWLIGLGFFALLGSLHPFAFLEGEATGGLFLMALAVFLFFRRRSAILAMYPEGSFGAEWGNIRVYRGAAILFVIGVLTFLNGLHLSHWGNTGPVFLIFLGIILVAERFAQNKVTPPVYPGYPGYPAPPVSNEPVADRDASTSIVPKYTRPTNDLSVDAENNSGEGR